MSKSTLADLFNGRRLPNDTHMVAILLGCGLAPTALAPWRMSRGRLASSRSDIAHVKEDLFEHNRDLKDRLTTAQDEVRDLRVREQELAAQLADKEAKCQHLEAELERLRRTHVSTGLRSPAGEPGRYGELHAIHEREREHVESMRGELDGIRRARLSAEQRVELAAAESHDSDQTTRVIDLMELHFTRAEYERRLREELAGQLKSTAARLAELEVILVKYQLDAHEHGVEPPVAAAQPAPETANRHVPVQPVPWWRRLFSRTPI